MVSGNSFVESFLETISFVKLHVFKGTMVFGVMENGLIYRSKNGI
jgi:hypothetical protein